MKSKKKSGKSKSKMPKADDITCWDKKPNAIDNEGNTSIDVFRKNASRDEFQ